jgi:hypothetical protein
MATDPKSQLTIEPVHVRAEQPIIHVPTPAAPAPTPAAKPTPTAPPTAAHTVPPKPQSAPTKTPPVDTSNSVTTAIIATVVIILGLAGLAVLAYIKTQK